jgi:hypothetical protein
MNIIYNGMTCHSIDTNGLIALILKSISCISGVFFSHFHLVYKKLVWLSI